MDEKIFGTGKDLKVGKHVLINGEPCRIVSIDISKPGKHGAAKMRIVGVGIFDNQKRNLLIPSDAEVEIPVIRRSGAQILSISGDSIQVMDPDTYETYYVQLPEELKADATEGAEAEIIEAMGKKKVVRIKKV